MEGNVVATLVKVPAALNYELHKIAMSEKQTLQQICLEAFQEYVSRHKVELVKRS